MKYTYNAYMIIMAYTALNKILCRVDLEINSMQSGFSNKLFINS